MNITDEMLMAYADGELDAEKSIVVEVAMANDPALAARVQEHRALRAQLQGAFDPVLDEPVPDRLLTAAEAPVQSRSTVIDLSQVRQQRQATPRPHWSLPQWAAIAASLMIGVFIGHRALQGNDPLDMRDGELVARGSLADALTAKLSNDETGAYRIGFSFRTQQGAYCRSFASTEQQAVAGIACREADAWRVKSLTQAPATTGGYRMAGSSLPPALQATVTDIMQGEPLTLEEETAARTGGWK